MACAGLLHVRLSRPRGRGLLCLTSVAVCGPGSCSGKRAGVSSLAAEPGSAVPRIALHSGLRRPVSGARALGAPHVLGCRRASPRSGQLAPPRLPVLPELRRCVPRWSGRCSWPAVVASHPGCTRSCSVTRGSPRRFPETSSTWVPLSCSSVSRIPAASTSLNASLFFLSQPVHRTPPGSPLSGPKGENVHPPQPQAKAGFLGGVVIRFLSLGGRSPTRPAFQCQKTMVSIQFF